MTAPVNMNEEVKVRTTFRPDEEITVPRWERDNLKALGVLYEGKAETDDGARRSVEQQQAADAAGKAGQK